MRCPPGGTKVEEAVIIRNPFSECGKERHLLQYIIFPIYNEKLYVPLSRLLKILDLRP